MQTVWPVDHGDRVGAARTRAYFLPGSPSENPVASIVSPLVGRHRTGVQLSVGRPPPGVQMMRPRALVGMAAVGVVLLAACARAAPSGTLEDVAADVVARLHAAGTVAHERAA